jgi:hypothetical protein
MESKTIFPAMGLPATYHIRVIGQLDENWSNRLGGLTISSTCSDESQVITSLKGRLIDQAALFGVLMALYDSRLPLVSVEFLGEDQPMAKDSHGIP